MTGGYVEWIALALGVVAVAIAVWDNVRDRYYYSRKTGPVRVELTRFDLPGPEVRVHHVRVGQSFKEMHGVQLRIEWSMWNHVSWPVFVTLNVSHSGADSTQTWVTVVDEMAGEVDSQWFIPPRQPVRRTLWFLWPLGTDGTIAPSVMVGGRKWTTKKWAAKTLRWVDGSPKLA